MVYKILIKGINKNVAALGKDNQEPSKWIADWLVKEHLFCQNVNY